MPPRATLHAGCYAAAHSAVVMVAAMSVIQSARCVYRAAVARYYDASAPRADTRCAFAIPAFVSRRASAADVTPSMPSYMRRVECHCCAAQRDGDAASALLRYYAAEAALLLRFAR